MEELRGISKLELPKDMAQQQTKVYLLKTTAFLAPNIRTDLHSIRFLSVLSFLERFLLNVLFRPHFTISDD